LTDKEKRKEFRKREKKIAYWGGTPVELGVGVTPSDTFYEERKLYLLKLLPEAYKWVNNKSKLHNPRVNNNTNRTPSQCISRLLWKAKARAKKKGLAFDITKEDLYIPEKCPILGIEISYKNKVTSDNSPSLDRKDSSVGYVKGNVWIVSNRANTIKSSGTAEEHLKIYKAMKSLGLD